LDESLVTASAILRVVALHPLRQACRALLRSPAFTIPALLTLALGLGANTAMFSATWGLLLRPLPYPHPDRLVRLYETRGDSGQQPVSLADLLDWRSQSHGFTGIAAFRPRSFGLSSGGEIDVVQAGMVTADFFSILGAAPIVGRAFTEAEEIGEVPVALIGHRLWRERFGGDPSIAGRRILLNDVPRTILGVLPAGFEFPMGGKIPDLYLPLSRKDYGTSREIRSLGALGRLRPDSTLATAQTELRSIAARLALAYPGSNAKVGGEIQTLDEALRGKNRRPLLLLTGAALLLLVIACANVANLLLARALARIQAVAIRAALGARLGDLMRQFLAEGLILSLFGSALGLLVAGAWIRLLPLALPLAGGTGLPAGAADPLRLDISTFALALGLAAATGLLFALVPTLVVRRSDLQAVLRDGGAAVTPRHRLSSALVVGQVALSVMLLLGAGLLLRSFFDLLATDPGFRSRDVELFGIGLPDARYGSDLKILPFHQALLDRLSRLSGVEAAGAVARLPLAGEGFTSAFSVVGAPPVPRERMPSAALNVASPDYFTALRIPLLAGRVFTRQDGPASPRVALVNQAFARRYWPDRNSIGQRLELRWTSDINPPGTVWEIVGVVGNVRQRALEEASAPEIYLPIGQYPLDGCTYVLKTRRHDPALAAAVRADVAALDPQLERIELRSFSETVRESLSNRRLALLLTALFAGVALLVTAVGLYGVVAYGVAQRRREIALRRTLGAGTSQVASLVLGQGLRLTLLGLALGLAGFYGLSRGIESQLYGVTAADPLTTVAIALLLALVSLAACAVPSLRAARIEPMGSLRS
jgi:putative ABC transport system permease protein